MGAYTNADNVRQLYPALNELTSLTDTQIDFYVAQAEAEIDARLAVRYALPFSAVPPLVEALATEYALIKLMDRFYSSEAPAKNDWKEVRRREMKELLVALADGTATLVTTTGAVITTATGAGIESDTSDYTPTFNHLDPIMQAVDKDRLDTEEDALD